MLRIWFSSDPADTIDLSLISLEVEHGRNYAVATDLRGNAHRVKFSDERYPVAARLTLAASHLGLQTTNADRLRELLLERLESGESVTAFVEETSLAYKLVLTETRPPLLGCGELSEVATRSAVAVEAIVTDDGVFTDFGDVGSALWRGRV